MFVQPVVHVLKKWDWWILSWESGSGETGLCLSKTLYTDVLIVRGALVLVIL